VHSIAAGRQYYRVSIDGRTAARLHRRSIRVDRGKPGRRQFLVWGRWRDYPHSTAPGAHRLQGRRGHLAAAATRDSV